jgi:hypothetical protein
MSLIDHVHRFAEMIHFQPNDRLQLVNNIIARGTQPFEEVPLPLRHLQLYMARFLFEYERSQLLLHPYILDKDIETQRRFRIVLNSSIDPGSYSWLFALPNGGLESLDQCMTPLEF